MFGVKVISSNTLVHIIWNTCHIMISAMLIQVAPIYLLFFFSLLAILYAINKEVLFQALASNLQSLYFDLFYFGLGI